MYTMVGAWSNNEELISSLGLGNILKSLVEFATFHPYREAVGYPWAVDQGFSDDLYSLLLFCCY